MIEIIRSRMDGIIAGTIINYFKYIYITVIKR